MKRKKKGNKGFLVWDISATNQLKRIAIDVGFKIISVNPKDKELGDSALARKYAKGRYPVCTGDKTAWKDMLSGSGATAIIFFDHPSKEYFGVFKGNFYKFISKHTSATLRGYMWVVSVSGNKKVELDK